MPRPGGGTYAIDFDASDTVFTLSGPTLMRSDDLGLTWQALANTCGCWSTGVSVHRPNARYMYALGASPDLTCLTEDGGITWPDVTNLSGGGVDIRVSQANPFDVVKAGPGVAWKSLDGGRNWTPSALRGAMCCLDRSPTTPSVVLAGTSEGVFKSSDGVQTWRESRIRSQILAVTSVAIDPSTSSSSGRS